MSHIFSSLEGANEGSKNQKSISEAANDSMGHGLNWWSGAGSPPGEESGLSQLPLAIANMSDRGLRTTLKYP